MLEVYTIEVYHLKKMNTNYQYEIRKKGKYLREKRPQWITARKKLTNAINMIKTFKNDIFMNYLYNFPPTFLDYILLDHHLVIGQYFFCKYFYREKNRKIPQPLLLLLIKICFFIINNVHKACRATYKHTSSL